MRIVSDTPIKYNDPLSCQPLLLGKGEEGKNKSQVSVLNQQMCRGCFLGRVGALGPEVSLLSPSCGADLPPSQRRRACVDAQRESLEEIQSQAEEHVSCGLEVWGAV